MYLRCRYSKNETVFSFHDELVTMPHATEPKFRNALFGVRSGLRVNSETERFSTEPDNLRLRWLSLAD